MKNKNKIILTLSLFILLALGATFISYKLIYTDSSPTSPPSSTANSIDASETETDADTETNIDTKPDGDTEAEANTDTEADTAANTESDADADTSAETETTGQTFTLDELAQYDGQNGNPAYVAIDGIVYDVSSLSQWVNGKHNGVTAGRDLTDFISSSPHGRPILERAVEVGTLVSN